MPPIPIIVTSSSFKSLLSVISWRDGLLFKVPPTFLINKTTSFEPLVVFFGHSPENIQHRILPPNGCAVKTAVIVEGRLFWCFGRNE